MATFDQAYQLKEKISRRFLKQKNIYGIGIGYADPKNPQRGAALILYGANFSSVSAHFPKKHGTVSIQGNTVPIPVRMKKCCKFSSHVKTCPFPVHPIQQQKFRPVPTGVIVGHPFTSGTAGLIVANKAGQLFLASNNHVLNHDNTASSTETIQPGGVDGGIPSDDRIGQLFQFVKLRKDKVNLLDAALSIPDRQQLLKARYLSIGKIPGHLSQYKAGDRFIKVGRSTGLVNGTVEAINADVIVDYGDYGGLGEILFRNQTIITGRKPIVLPGDSGSVWLTPCGHFAAAMTYARTIDGKLSINFPSFCLRQHPPLGRKRGQENRARILH